MLLAQDELDFKTFYQCKNINCDDYLCVFVYSNKKPKSNKCKSCRFGMIIPSDEYLKQFGMI